MSDWLRPFLMLFYAPTRGMAAVRDRAPLGQAVALAFLIQSAYLLYVMWPHLFNAEEMVWNGAGGFTSVIWRVIGSILFNAIIFVPVIIFVSNVIERRGSFALALQQEYAPVASTILYARAAASIAALPLAALLRSSGAEAMIFVEMTKRLEDFSQQGEMTPAQILATNPLLLPESFALTLLIPLFGIWALIAVREVLRLTWLRAVGVIFASTLIMVPMAVIFGQLFSWVFASPFLLIVLFFLMRGYFGEVMRGQRARAAFKQNLESATVNPADASAHYNLGLIHLQRKEFDDARQRFERAIEIDADEVDSHFQLGRIARAQHRLGEAINHFSQVVVRDPAHAQHEIWREIGATYINAGQFGDAQEALEKFLEPRRTDPEGLYLMGRALAGLNRQREATEYMQACIEAVKTAPAYKYRAEKRWLNEAQQFLRSQA